MERGATTVISSRIVRGFMTPPPTLIVSHEPLLCLGLRAFLMIRLQVPECFEATSLIEAQYLLDQHSPHLIIVAASFLAEDTPRMVKELRRGKHPPPVIVVTSRPQADYVRRVIHAGALCVVTSSDSLDELNHAVRSALHGGMHVSPRATGGLLDALHGQNGKSEAQLRSLSDREMEVFDLVGHGMSGKDIADHLHISVKTVETHKHRIKEKLHLPHSTQLVKAAATHVMRHPSDDENGGHEPTSQR